nr:hypothetical protein [Tanacetum cinerariifolium]
MKYIEEQIDGKAMINSIQNGDQPLPVIAQVSLAGNAQNAPPTLKDPKFWTAEEKKTRKIDRFERSLLIQGLSNDIYSLIDSNETAKDLWDALERQMRGSEYGEQDRKAAILYEYETFKAIEGEQLLDTYLRDVNDALGYKKKAVVVTSDPLALVAEKTKVSKRNEKVVSLDSEGSGADDFSELKKITALLAIAFNRRKIYSKPTNNNLRTSSTSQTKLGWSPVVNMIRKSNANMVFMAQIEKVLSDSDESSSSTRETIAEVAYYTSDSESESAILSGADNHPPMLEKDMYDSWKSRMELFMLNRQHGRMILESVEHGPLLWPTIEEDGVTRLKKYSELSAAEAIQADCDVKATNIILQALPSKIYALVNTHKVAKDLWERIQMLMQGTSLTKQERECKLYDEFYKFAYWKGETLRDFYLKFPLLLNDMKMYNMKLEQFQVNTKFLNTLPPEWSKFVTDVKLVRDLHTTNINTLSSSESAPTFMELFEINKLKARPQAKDTVILKLKEKLRSLNGDVNARN